MRPNTAKLTEALSFIREASREDQNMILAEIIKISSPEQKKFIQLSIFGVAEDIILPNPVNQKALVLHTLIFPPAEISIGYWMIMYKTHKFSTRLGELERMLGVALVNREWRDFINRFDHKSEYRVYIPVLDREKYIEYYNIVNV